MTSENVHITSGLSGEAKFRQFVTAIGLAPTQATFRAASATASFAPSRGSMATNLPLPSRHIAIALLVSFTRITAASAPGRIAVFVRTIVSYCSYTQRFEAMLGDDRSVFNACSELQVAGSKFSVL